MLDEQTLIEQIKSAHFVDQVDSALRPLSFSPQTRGIVTRVLEYVAEKMLPQLEGAADEWFNLVTRAARLNCTVAEHDILTEALKRHPEDVDLLCNLFQLQYGHQSLGLAEETWQRLESLGEDRTGPHWRYWVFGATYFARYRHDRTRALELLDRGFSRVRLADLLNVLRHYRTVLLDGGAISLPESEQDVVATHGEYVRIIERRYRDGLALGIENSYVLATDLAHLLREKSAGENLERASKILDEALHFLDVAELLYTNDANHPITDIYIEKAIALMARRRYADALQIFRSLPRHLLDGSLEVMARYAANLTSQVFEEATQQSAESTSELEARIVQLELTLGQVLVLLKRLGEGE